MSAIASGVVGAIAAYILIAIAERSQRCAAKLSDGWKVLTPSWMIVIALVGSAALATAIGALIATSDPAPGRSDLQAGSALLLLLTFSAGAIYLAWTTFGLAVKWKSNELRFRRAFGGEVVQRFSDVISVRKSEVSGEYRLRFRDGSGLSFSAHMHGSNELVAKLPRRAFADRS